MGVSGGAGEDSGVALASRASTLAPESELVGGVVGSVVCPRQQPSQVQSLNFILLCMAVSGLGVMLRTEQGG